MERRRSSRRRRYKRSFAKKCKECFRQFVAFMFSNVGIIGLVVGYTIAGSFIFMTIEHKHQLEIYQRALNRRNFFVEKFWNLTLELNPFEKEEYEKIVMQELYEYQKDVVVFIRKGYNGPDNKDYAAQWSFAGAFLYSLTVITTIGYGNIFPHTPEGKITTIVYAIIGMPLFLLYLSNIGDVMARSFKWVYANCCLCRWCPGVAKRRAERRIQREQMELETNSNSSASNASWQMAAQSPRVSIVSHQTELTNALTEGDYDVQAVTVPITICLAIMVGYICGGALLFCKWEDWAFLDASYFCFISLSTIGFGDLVPGDKIYGKGKNFYSGVLELSFVFCSMYLMLGMALIAMCFNLMQEEVIHKIRTVVRTIKYVLRCR